MGKINVRCGFAAAALAFIASNAFAHELPFASGALILREGGFVQLRADIPFVALMHSAIAPETPFMMFLLDEASAADDRLEQDIVTTQRFMAAKTTLILNGDDRWSAKNWVWPDTKTIIGVIRLSLVDVNSGHDQVEMVSLAADVRAPFAVRSIAIEFPQGVGPVLMNAYRPMEQLVQAGKPSAEFVLAR